ncbi:hypothetical protein [Pseudalkalibacillus berkeleyi]|uniref:Uncharacterized protein n=1 Tax=Pseudalkalibacillus berkeleyi TaxID=1069813 RepID=A0ABS9GY68_9BACL|nr:hypothetical protein [Pseudalkalibacillus berkeleyi]MCF6136448.1 hypothetical protein [Pseudalkalibacillus berkeleyi]
MIKKLMTNVTVALMVVAFSTGSLDGIEEIKVEKSVEVDILSDEKLPPEH